MSLLDKLGQHSVWESFYEYKLSLAVPKEFTRELRSFIDEKRYLPVYEAIRAGERFPLPRKSVISKMGSSKKRVVYTYPAPENTVLKLLTYLLLRKYDGLFTPGLFSFRPGKTAKDAVRRLLRIEGLASKYVYKADIHDYFNSVPVEMLLPQLWTILGDDAELYNFLAALLTEPCVRYRGRELEEKKGIMAGTPLSAFYANVFLAGLDRHFEDAGVIYSRYSDDIILFTDTPDARRNCELYVHAYLDGCALEINPSKEERYEPGEGFTFLGFRVDGDNVDIAPATLKKLKQKMRRKRDALARWQKRGELGGVNAAKAFIRVFNRKLLESPRDNELSWSSWFFPVINTSESLRAIDLYAQDCLRYLVSGRHTKARFNVRYDDLKAMGYRSLVHEYYLHTEAERASHRTAQRRESGLSGGCITDSDASSTRGLSDPAALS